MTENDDKIKELISKVMTEIVKKEKKLGQYARKTIPTDEFIDLAIKKTRQEILGDNIIPMPKAELDILLKRERHKTQQEIIEKIDKVFVLKSMVHIDDWKQLKKEWKR